MQADRERTIKLSVVIPVRGSTQGLDSALTSYAGALEDLGSSFEIVLTCTPETAPACAQTAAIGASVRVQPAAKDAWGSCVRAGLAAATGEILCYANWERTSAAALAQMLRYALSDSEVVFRANRRTRDSVQQRLGSLLFNLECRALLGITAWDVNGTPKTFSRQRSRLMELTRDDDLIDAEFAVVCAREGYRVAEVPIDADLASGHARRPDYAAALKMYVGACGLRRGSDGEPSAHRSSRFRTFC